MEVLKTKEYIPVDITSSTPLNPNKNEINQDAPSVSCLSKFTSLSVSNQVGIGLLGTTAVFSILQAGMQGDCAISGGTGACTAGFVLRPLLESVTTSGLGLLLLSAEGSLPAWKTLSSLPLAQRAAVGGLIGSAGVFLVAAGLEAQCPVLGGIGFCAAGFVVESLAQGVSATSLGILLYNKLR